MRDAIALILILATYGGVVAMSWPLLRMTSGSLRVALRAWLRGRGVLGQNFAFSLCVGGPLLIGHAVGIRVVALAVATSLGWIPRGTPVFPAC